VAGAMQRPYVLDPARFLGASLGNDPRIRYVSVGQGALTPAAQRAKG